MNSVTAAGVRYESVNPAKRSRILLPVVIVLLATLAVYALVWYVLIHPRNAFNPLRTPPQLAASFGELRPDHFHMGIDMRTGGKENLPVYAVEDGYISRVVIEQGGFGKALFITHPNGRTSLYAHLNRFYDAVEKAIRDKQYADESWLQDVSFTPGRFPVQKGQLVAYSGNTGSSEGPHLHFEWRDTKTGDNLNPLSAGLRIEDHTPPVIQGLYWYDRRYSTYETTANTINIKGGKGNYQAKRDIVKLTSPVISLGIRAEDLMDDSKFKFGIAAAELWFDDERVHAYSLNRLSYSDTRYINACIDYGKYITAGIYIQHLSLLPGNRLPMLQGDGIIRLRDRRPHAIMIRLKDAAGNETRFRCQVQLAQVDEPDYQRRQHTTMLMPNKANRISTGQMQLSFAAGALYDTVPFVWREEAGTGARKASASITLHKPTVPLHTPYTVGLKTTLAAQDVLRNRTVMRLTNFKNKVVTKGKWQGNYMMASFNQFGTVQLLTDTIPPQIDTPGWPADHVFTGQAPLQLLCNDNLGSIARFRAELDGKWLMFSQKGDLFTYLFDEHGKPGRHVLTVQVTDVAGNVRKQQFVVWNR